MLLSSTFLLHMLLVSAATIGECCTNLIVTPGASADGSAMLAYNTDDTELFGFLFHYPAHSYTHNNDTKSLSSTSAPPPRKIYEWETGIYLGTISDVVETHNVIGNCNDAGLCIGETTFGGINILQNPHPDSIIDYGSLIWIALQRSATAREAIDTMTRLMGKYGYASKWGESYSLVDHKEGWIMDVISKGPNELGAVWVAQRIPDGSVAAHANHARITTFPRDDPDNCLYADDVVSFARENKLYRGTDDAFSFSDVYDAKPASKLRYAESRIWDMYVALSRDDDFAKRHLDFAMGKDRRNPMPLAIKPRNLVTLDDVRERMASHYEGTPFEYGYEAAGGLFSHPYRPRPYQWYNERTGDLYVNERNIGVEKTGINFIAQIRPHMPPPLRALLWFGVDDASTSPRFPAYAASTDVSSAFKGYSTAQGHVRPILQFDLTKAFWVQNMVSNFAYSRWRDAYPVVKDQIDAIQADFVAQVRKMDNQALDMYYSAGPDAAIEEVTQFSISVADKLHRQWMDFYGQLFARFRDFVTTENDPTNLACGCKTTEVGMTDAWKERIIEETGRHYWVKDDAPNL